MIELIGKNKFFHINEQICSILRLCAFFVLLIIPTFHASANALLTSETYQNKTLSDTITSHQKYRKIIGVVIDKNGEPIIGASIYVKGTKSGTITDINGKFSIDASDKATLIVSYIGYNTINVKANSKEEMHVQLEENVRDLEEVTVIAYGTQKKVTLTGAIETVNKKEINTTPNVNVQNMLAGKVSGLRIQQKSGEPGNYSTSMDIRGMGTPLIVIDGVIKDISEFQRLEPNDIENVTVLKDASAAIYGLRSANGVVLVTTRRGQSGKAKIEYSTTFGVQSPSGLPAVLNAPQYAELKREQDYNMGRGINATFTAEDVERFKSVKATDWYNEAMKQYAPQIHHNLTASGANDITNYYVSLGYYGDDGIWKSDALNYKRFNIKSNLGFNINKNLKGEVLFSAMSDEKNQPYKDSWEFFKALWLLRPTETPYANNNLNYMQDVNSGLNPLAMMDPNISGYRKLKNKTLNTTFTLNYDVPFINGLSAKFLYSYNYQNSNNKEFKKEYSLYKYDSGSDVYNSVIYNSPSSLVKQTTERIQQLLQLSLNYETTFLKYNKIKALMLFEASKSDFDNIYASRNFDMDAVDQLFAGSNDLQVGTSNPNNVGQFSNMGLVGRLNYDYKSKYIAEFSFREDGSSRFAPGHRWGFFPAASLGYRISEEDFIKKVDALSFINNLKLRASYGLMGDDSSSGYQFLSGYDYPGSSYVFGDKIVQGLGFRSLPNELLSWYTSKTLNLGIDVNLWNGKLTFQTDFFWRNRDGLLGQMNASVPSTIGASLPQENLLSDMTKGFEVTIGHRNKINDFKYSISMNFALTRRMWGERYDESVGVNSMDQWRNKYSNRYADMGWGYSAANSKQFTSNQDIWNSPVQDGHGGITLFPGDWKYKDWNGDGIIDANDMHPIAYENQNGVSNPKMTYGLTLTAEWKGFDANILLQGGAGFNVMYFEQLQYPLCFGGNGLAFFYDRWHQDALGNWIAGTWPTTHDPGQASLNNIQRSEQTTHDASYVRLKTFGVGYSVPKSFIKQIHIESVRLFVNGYNLFTLSKLDFVDPEHPQDAYGYFYPVMKSFDFGLNITF